MANRGLILIRDLAVPMKLGIRDWERQSEQTIRFDLELTIDFTNLVASRNFADTIDYVAVVDAVTSHCREHPTGLFEILADDLCRLLLDEFPLFAVAVTVKKPSPESMDAAFVGCSYRRKAARIKTEYVEHAHADDFDGLALPDPDKAHGKRVLITGSAHGLGAAIGRHLAEHGWRVGLHYNRSADAATALAETLDGGREGGPWACAFGADMGDAEAIGRLVSQTHETLGGLDAVIQNVGVYLVRPLAETAPETFHEIVNANLCGTHALLHHAMPHLRRVNGRAIAIGDASAHANLGYPDSTPYHVTKAALAPLVKSFAAAEARNGVTINLVNPGIMANTDDLPPNVEKALPIGRVAEYGDVTPAIEFLLSGDAAYITGTTLDVAGGFGIRHAP